jgi:hypothetical protein
MGRPRIHENAAARKRAQRARDKAKLDTASGEKALEVLDSKLGKGLKEGGTRLEKLLEMSIEAMRDLGLKETVIKFVLQKQYDMREAIILNDKQRHLEQSMEKVMEAVKQVVIKHGLEDEFFQIISPSLEAHHVRTWET